MAREFVGPTDPADFYRFNFNTGGTLNVSLGELFGNLNLRLFDSNGSLIGSSSNNGTAGESITINNADAGMYFVRVGSQSGGASLYKLNVTGPDVTVED